MHPLLERQIQQYLVPAGIEPARLLTFLQAVDSAWRQADEARQQAEHALKEEQRAEANLEQLLFLLGNTLESTVDGLLVLDRHARVMRFNRSFSEMWAVPDDILAFWDHDSLMQHVLGQVSDPAAFMEKIAHLCAHPEEACHDSFTCSDGRIIERHSLPQFQGVGDIGRVLSFTDVTAQRRAEAALLREKEEQKQLIARLEEAHNQLLQSEKMASIGQLAAGVAHEINNPIGFVNSNLNSLRAYVANLLAVLEAWEAAEPLLPDGAVKDGIHAAKKKADLDYLKEDVLSLLTETTDGIERVRRIVQGLKDFSHADSSEWMEVDLHQGLESTLNVVHNEIKYKAHVVKEYGALPKLRCLPAQLNQVFMNLLVNAAQAIDGQGTITLRTGHDDDEAWVEISDTGRGIPPEHLNRIFDPFFTTKPVGKGTGLGLSISYGIMNKHGGRIEVASAPGQGSTFRLILPIHFKPSPDHA